MTDDDATWIPITTRGGRIPSTLEGMSPVAAYNLGWQESRDQMARDTRNSKGRGYEEEHPIEVKDIPREPDLAKRLKDIGALRGGGAVDDHAPWVNAPLSIVLTEAQRARDDATRTGAMLITPHGEKIPIPSHVAAQIESIRYKGDQEVQVVLDADRDPEFSDDETTQAEEPVEDRLQRAFCNGFIDGVRRGSWGKFDHS